MADHDHQHPLLAAQLPEEARDLDLMPYIEVRGRLVQQEDAGLLDQSAGQDHLLVLTRGELIELAHRQIRDAQAFEDLVDLREVLIVRAPFAVGLAPHQHGIHHLHREGVGGGHRHVPHLLR